MDSKPWVTYFEANRQNRPEPDWQLPYPEDASTAARFARSFSHFQLGESGEGRCLLAEARRAYPDDPLYCEALNLFIAEEQEHARLLGRLVERFGGRLIQRHWTHSLFRLFRRALGLHFEIQVLVIAELVGTAYYRLLKLRVRDRVVEQACDLILRDEARHIAFHAERFASSQTLWLPMEHALWEAQFQGLFLAAAVVAWFDHASALRAAGAQRREFFREARKECIAFLRAIETARWPSFPLNASSVRGVATRSSHETA
jgi:hypothetical protein